LAQLQELPKQKKKKLYSMGLVSKSQIYTLLQMITKFEIPESTAPSSGQH
jgi:hypothetical protein